MTKKSLARQQRDAQAKEDDIIKSSLAKGSIWDDLRNIHTSYLNGILQTNGALLDVYKTPGLLGFIAKDNVDRVKVSLRGMGNDFDQMQRELAEIFAKHSDRTGSAKDVDDFALAMGHYENYQAYNARFLNVIKPTYDFLAVQGGMAAQAQDIFEQYAAKHNTRDSEEIARIIQRENEEAGQAVTTAAPETN